LFFMGCSVLSGIFALRHHQHGALVLFVSGLVLSVFSWLIPFFGKFIYRIWMGIGVIMGGIVSRLILVIIYFLVMMPIGLIFKILGRDELSVKKHQQPSYWKDLPETSPESYKHLF